MPKQKQYRLNRDASNFKKGDVFYVTQSGTVVFKHEDNSCSGIIRTVFLQWLALDWLEEVSDETKEEKWVPKEGDIVEYLQFSIKNTKFEAPECQVGNGYWEALVKSSHYFKPGEGQRHADALNKLVNDYLKSI